MLGQDHPGPAARADLDAHLYSCDDAVDRHAAVVTPAAGPTLEKVTSWSAARRLAQPVEVQVGSFERWMQRDARFAEQIAARARGVGYPVVVTDGTASPDDVLVAVTSLLDIRPR